MCVRCMSPPTTTTIKKSLQVTVACRPQDRVACQQASKAASAQLMSMGLSTVPSIDVIGEGTAYSLPSESCGGVVVYSGDMRTACKNTLDERLKICFEQSTPKVRWRPLRVEGEEGGDHQRPAEEKADIWNLDVCLTSGAPV